MVHKIKRDCKSPKLGAIFLGEEEVVMDFRWLSENSTCCV